MSRNNTTYHVALVLDNTECYYFEIREYIKDNLDNKGLYKSEAVDKLEAWLKDWVEDAVYAELDKLDGMGGEIIKELFDMSDVDWNDLADGYLEDFEDPEDE